MLFFLFIIYYNKKGYFNMGNNKKNKFNLKNIKKNTCNSLFEIEYFLNNFNSFLQYLKLFKFFKNK